MTRRPNRYVIPAVYRRAAENMAKGLPRSRKGGVLKVYHSDGLVTEFRFMRSSSPVDITHALREYHPLFTRDWCGIPGSMEFTALLALGVTLHAEFRGEVSPHRSTPAATLVWATTPENLHAELRAQNMPLRLDP